ncbi:PD-(D/E)XK nuclease domain-containing protein [Methanospirillum hungatei]|uniref:PD-(D/E)XK nuclease domain-containing protein n=1 Tax=Methanospirillum hungatei TaxID=2203 RepID=UPI002A1B8758|nr:PD-(D/E)XK nuclease domain-containing protein [Methanospirillum hungatei]
MWLFDFKVQEFGSTSTISPLEKIQENGYSEKYQNEGLAIYEIEGEFDPKSRNIVKWEVQEPENLNG